MKLKKNLLMVSFIFTGLACTRSNVDNGFVPGPPAPGNETPRNAGIVTLKNFDAQITGVTVTKTGRTFVSVPRWRDGIPYSVAEIQADGTVVPYPNAAWNEGNGTPVDEKFVCVQSVVAYGDSLFVLDPSNPKMKGVVGTPKLYEFDLTTNTLKNTWSFAENIAPPMSYLNDLRLDPATNKIFMTDSGLGALVVLDLPSGQSRRLLDQHPSTKGEVMVLRNQGKAFVKDDGQPQRINSDGIALNEGFVYYHALTGRHLYRIPTAALADESLSAAQLASQIEDLGLTPPTDGMIFDGKGNLIMGDLENGGIVYRTPAGEVKPLTTSTGLHWPDTFSIDPNGQLVFTDSHLDEAAPGQPLPAIQFNLYRMPTP
jgi:sugar lactone lactonase YvrE